MKSDGFTLIETIVALSILLVIASLFPQMIHLFDPSKKPTINPLEITVFLNQMSMEVREAKHISVTSDQLYLEKWDGDVATFERYGSRIRRQVNGRGHEIVLQNVHTVSFRIIDSSVVVLTVIGQSGRVYERRLSTVYEKPGTSS